MLLSRNNGDFNMVQFGIHHVDSTVKMIIKSFILTNPIWAAFNPDPDECFSVVRNKVLVCVDDAVSFVLLHNNKVIGAALQLDILTFQTQYQMYKQNPLKLNEMFTFLGKVADELEAPLLKIQSKKGEEFYGFYGVLDADYKNNGMSTWFWHACFFNAKLLGAKSYYTRTTNPKSHSILLKLGAVDINQIKISKAEIGVKDFTIYLIKLNLDKNFLLMRSLL